MSEWDEKDYQPGSFRGQPFHILSMENEIGRRQVVHEFAVRDFAYAEDLGLKIRRFTFEAVVGGKDYKKKRNDLRTAFEAPGPGVLIHPWWGPYLVAIESITVNESTKEGGIVRFSVKAVQVEKDLPPTVTINARADVAESADDFVTKAEKGFAKTFAGVSAVTNEVRIALGATVGRATRDLRRIRGAIGSVIGVIDDYSNAISDLEDAAVSIILTPSALASSLSGLFATIYGGIGKIAAAGSTSAGAPGVLIDTVRALTRAASDADRFGYEPPSPSVTPQRLRENELQSALSTYVRTASIGAVVAVATQLPFTNTEQTEALNETITSILDDLESRVDDETWASLQTLRASSTRFLTNASAFLPSLAVYTPVETTPVLCIAYSLYDDAARDEEIIARNHVTHPLFAQGGVPLQVLGNA